MEDVNYCILIGRLTRDAELKYTNSGLAVSNFSIAVNRRKKQGEGWTDEVSYFDIALFGKRAESLNQYLGKGQQVAVEGSLIQDCWEQEGQKRSKIKIGCNNVQLLGGKPQGSVGGQQGGFQPSGNNTGSQQNRGGGYQGGNNGYQQGGYNNNGYSSEPEFEDDIPF